MSKCFLCFELCLFTQEHIVELCRDIGQRIVGRYCGCIKNQAFSVRFQTSKSWFLFFSFLLRPKGLLVYRLFSGFSWVSVGRFGILYVLGLSLLLSLSHYLPIQFGSFGFIVVIYATTRHGVKEPLHNFTRRSQFVMNCWDFFLLHINGKIEQHGWSCLGISGESSDGF